MTDVLPDREQSTVSPVHPDGSSGLWGIRLAVAAIILANVIAFAAVERGYNAGKAVTKFSTVGTFYLAAIGIFMYPRLKLSPGDGLFVAIALSLIGATATSTTDVDVLEVFSLMAAATIGPACFVLYGIRMVRDRPSSPAA